MSTSPREIWGFISLPLPITSLQGSWRLSLAGTGSMDIQHDPSRASGDACLSYPCLQWDMPERFRCESLRLWHIPIQLTLLITLTGALWRPGSEQFKSTVLHIPRPKIPFHQMTSILDFNEKAMEETFSSSFLTVAQCWGLWLCSAPQGVSLRPQPTEAAGDGISSWLRLPQITARKLLIHASHPALCYRCCHHMACFLVLIFRKRPNSCFTVLFSYDGHF